MLLLSHFSHVWLCVTPQMAAHQAPPSLGPWDSPGKNTEVGCHFLLQCMKVRSESEVVQSCPTLSDPMDCRLPGSSIHGIFQARVLEWGAIAFSSFLLQAFYSDTPGLIPHVGCYLLSDLREVSCSSSFSLFIWKGDILIITSRTSWRIR